MNKQGFLNQIDMLLDIATTRDNEGKLYPDSEVIRLMMRRLISLKEQVRQFYPDNV